MNKTTAWFVAAFLTYFAIVLQSLYIHHKYTEPSQGQLEADLLRKEFLQLEHNAQTKDSQHPNDVSKHSNTTERKFWRFDEAGPSISRARTHYLSSIPQEHRLILSTALKSKTRNFDTEDAVSAFYKTIRETYATDPNNVFPKKLHLYEINPSITVLPKQYQTNKDWIRHFGPDRSPVYVASYRVAHETNCYDHETTVSLWDGDWNKLRNYKSDFLGISIMDQYLNILVDTTFDVNRVEGTKRLFDGYYGDYRVQNLGEQLYLSTVMNIVPFELSLAISDEESSPTNNVQGLGSKILDDSREMKPAFPRRDSTSLRLWIRRFVSCPPGGLIWGRANPGAVKNAKNLLYFATPSTSNNNTVIQAMLWPRHNPNSVQTVDVSKGCLKGKPRDWTEKEKILYPKEGRKQMQPDPSFETIDAQLFPGQDLFMPDRGSACCTTITAKSIFPLSKNLQGKLSIFDDEELLVAIVHPKTKYPGKKLPQGVVPNTYLSRFIAVLNREPYTIVAKSGAFCLGYPSNDVDGPNTNEANVINPLQWMPMIRLHFANETMNCPRIHFVTGMVDAVRNATQENSGEESVIVSYGVSDCLSRFVEIPKSEIIRMLKPSSR